MSTEIALRSTVPLSVANPPGPDPEVARFSELIELRGQGKVAEDDFRRYRVQNGIYGMRGQVDVQMVRVKVPGGLLSPEQLRGLAAVAEQYAGGTAHITTRQDVQLYGVALADVPAVLQRLAGAGLTTRESGGNIVRNVTACPLAGVCRREAFDVTPYALGLAAFLLRNPACQALPRKFKMAFSGCPTDCAMTATHDLGLVAAVRVEQGVEQLGFRLYAGGGLGAAPQAGVLLEPFTRAEDLVLTVLAVLRVFDRLGNRQNRGRARLKFLVNELGAEGFRQRVLDERRTLWASWPGGSPVLPEESRVPVVRPAPRPNGHRPPGTANDLEAWRRTNVVAQRQAGFYATYVTVPGGDLGVAQLRGLAALLVEHPGLELRTTATQNLVLRWGPASDLANVYGALWQLGLGQPGVHGPADPLGCPGADTCAVAITASHRLALELGRQLGAQPDLALDETLAEVTVRVSGCPNSCGLHHLAAIGLHGASRKVNGVSVPHYQLLLGGEQREGEVRFAQPVLRLPARRVPEAVRRLLERYRAERQPEQSFAAWLGELQGERLEAVRTWFADLAELPPQAEAPDLYTDWGAATPFRVDVGRSECGA